jgi:c-di-GMP-binding flagellar brake protein YcgR
MNPFRIDYQNPAATTAFTDRRTGRRYDIPLKLRWKVSRRKRLLEAGTGTTVDLSSCGILFETDQKMPEDGLVELSISWPALLHDSLPMQLIVVGRIVRVSGNLVAIDIAQHEFRTARAAFSGKS